MVVAYGWLNVIVLVLFQSVNNSFSLDKLSSIITNKPKYNELFDRAQPLCGNKLAKLMQNICELYNEPARRRRRHITRDCCPTANRETKGCSLRYLTMHYCKEMNKTGVENILEQMHQKDQSMAKSDLQDNETNLNANALAKDNPNNDYVQVRNATLSRRYRHRTLINHSSSEGNHEINHPQDKSVTGQKKRANRKCSCRKRRAKKARKFGESKGEVMFIVDDKPPIYPRMSGLPILLSTLNSGSYL